MRKLPNYETPDDWICPHCGEVSKIVGLRNEFDYSGTHCTYGRGGTYYPSDWGSPVCELCENYVDI